MILSIILAVLCGLVLVGLIIYAVCARIGYNIAFERKNVLRRAQKQATAENIAKFKIDFSWWGKQEQTEYSITSFDGLRLVGHFIKKDSKKIAILFHGYGGSYKEMQPYAKLFTDKNISVLCVENRAHGNSDGDMVGFGVLDSDDGIAWVNFVCDTFAGSRILLFGLSMGGATVCFMAGKKLSKNVVGIVADCAFCNIYQQFESTIKSATKIKPILTLKILSHYMKTVKNFDIKKDNATNFVKNTKVPILYIHGKLDKFVPIENSQKLFEATPENLRDKFFVDGAEHATSYATVGVEYEKKISNFLLKTLK